MADAWYTEMVGHVIRMKDGEFLRGVYEDMIELKGVRGRMK